MSIISNYFNKKNENEIEECIFYIKFINKIVEKLKILYNLSDDDLISSWEAFCVTNNQNPQTYLDEKSITMFKSFINIVL